MSTRRFPQAPDRQDRQSTISLYQTELFSRLGWFIRLRWLLTTGLLLGLIHPRLHYGPSSTLSKLFWFTVSIMIYNLVFTLIDRYLRSKPRRAPWENIAFALLQIVMDLMTLTFVVHWSGGVASVFVIYYVFPLVMASLLLYRWVCFVVAGFASAALNLVVYLETVGVLRHHPLPGFTHGYTNEMSLTFDVSSHPVLLFCLFYNLAFFVTVTMASTISRRLRQREREIEQFNFQLEDVNIAKSNFMRMASHEMRGPLSALDGMLNILSNKRGEGGECDPLCEELLERSSRRLKHLYELIDDLLAYSHLQSVDAQERSKPLDWGAAVAKSLEDLEPAAQGKGIELRAEIDPCEVLGDEEQFLTLGNNLIRNALRYTPEGGRVVVRLARRNKDAIFEVEDNGIGIETPALGFIFEEFFRAPSAKEHDSSGTGLGLSMCKSIVENHGGSISVSSVPHHRTVFSVRIPLINEPPRK